MGEASCREIHGRGMQAFEYGTEPCFNTLGKKVVLIGLGHR